MKLIHVSQLAPVEETIEDMLTRLEEFESLMEMVRINVYLTSFCSGSSFYCYNVLSLICMTDNEIYIFDERD
jgi:hypothetical protein